jgi:PAS domain S-box-containing protein
MQLNEFIPLSKEQLFIWLKTFSNQLSKGTVIIDIHDSNLSIVHANSEFVNLTNYPLEQLIGQNLSILQGHRTKTENASEFMFHIRHGIAHKFTLLHYTMHGSAFWNRMVIHPIRDDQHEIQYVLLTCEDFTQQLLDKMLSKLEHEVYEAIDNDDDIQSILTLITHKIESYYIRDVYCTIHLSNEQQALKTIGSNTLPIDIINELELFQIEPSVGYNESAIYLKDFKLNTTQISLFKRYHLNAVCGTWSKPILTPQGKLLGMLTLFHQEETELKQADIKYLNRLALLIQLSIKYAKQKSELSRLAFYDTETNIPNTHYFKTRLTQWMNEGKKGFMAIVHANEYNKIVDLYGRNAGANLLSQIVERLSHHNTPGEEFFARFSNSIVIGKITNETDITHHYCRIKPLIKEPYIIQGVENYITLKIGVSFFNSTMTIDQCIHQSDIALSKSRKISGTNAAVFEENSNQKLVEEMEIFNQLSYGIENGEFQVHLQPKINFQTLEVEGFEGLSRWQSHTLGNVPPTKFIPIAEQCGKIKEIDLLNFKTVLTWLQKRIDENKTVLPVALNVSPDHFYDPHFLKNTKAIFEQFSVPANYIKFEVTESMELVDFKKAKEILMALNEIGIESSIDDFGVGYSSLSYLPQLPFSEIKIDRSFINEMQEPGMLAVVQTIIQLAKNINMRAIAEGIETKEQLAMLQQLGCPAGQGFYFYKPMPIEEADKLLEV